MKTWRKNLFIGALSLTTALGMLPEGIASQPFDESLPRIRTRMQMRLQDPTVVFSEGTKYKQVLLVTGEKITKGPAIKDMAIAKKNAVAPNADGDFIFPYPSREFDIVSGFTNVKKAFDLVEGDLRELHETYPNNDLIKTAYNRWHSKRPQLTIYPFDESDVNNAYYTRGDDGTRSIHFLPISKNGKITDWTVRSPDVLWHESWHGVLDIIKELYFTTDLLETGAVHEFVGDMGTLFGTLSDADLCNRVICTTKGDLHVDSFLPNVGEGFGKNFGWKSLRNLDDDLTIQSTDPEVHERSRVLAGVVYDVLASGVKGGLEELDGEYRDKPDMLLYDIAGFTRKMVIQAVVQMPDKEATFRDFAKQFSAVASHHPTYGSVFGDLKWGEYIKYEFERRGITGENKTTLKALAQLPLKAEEGHSICHTSVKRVKK